MSRITFSATVEGKEFPIAIGWDRRLSQCFVSISDVNLDDDDYEDDKFDAILTASAEGMSSRLGPDDCKRILERGGVTAPKGAFELLEKHMSINAGNVIVEIDVEGNKKVLYDEDSKSAATLGG
jgi:hypothetical protein